jgi:hypothetical protein
VTKFRRPNSPLLCLQLSKPAIAMATLHAFCHPNHGLSQTGAGSYAARTAANLGTFDRGRQGSVRGVLCALKGGFRRPSLEPMSSLWFEGGIETSVARHFEMRKRTYAVPCRDESCLQVFVKISSKRQSTFRDGDLQTSSLLVIHACNAVYLKVLRRTHHCEI